MKLDFLNELGTPSSAVRHEYVSLLAALIPFHQAHALEKLVWVSSVERGDKTLGTYLQTMIRLHSNIQAVPQLASMYGLHDLLLLDHGGLSLGRLSEFEKLTEAKKKVDKALASLDINFDMAVFKPTLRCRFCGQSKFMVTRYEQRRSADEGMTQIKQCTACEEEWV